MSLKISQKNWNDETYRSAILGVAEILNEDIEIELPKQKFKPYNVQIWLNDDIVKERDFDTKSQAKKFIVKELSKKKFVDAYADLKKYNKRNDDFDYWFYKQEDGKVVETLDI